MAGLLKQAHRLLKCNWQLFQTCPGDFLQSCTISHTDANLHRFSAVGTSRKKGSRGLAGRPHAEQTSMTPPPHHHDQIWHAAIQRESVCVCVCRLFLLPLSPFSACKQLTVSHPAPPRHPTPPPQGSPACKHHHSLPPRLLSHISGPLRA